MDGLMLASAALGAAIGWNSVTFGRALNRGEPLWPSGIILAVLLAAFTAIQVSR